MPRQGEYFVKSSHLKTESIVYKWNYITFIREWGRQRMENPVLMNYATAKLNLEFRNSKRRKQRLTQLSHIYFKNYLKYAANQNKFQDNISAV